MMKSLLRSDDRGKGRDYESSIRLKSQTLPGVEFTIYRISFGRRMDLCRRVRDIGQKLEFLEAGKHFHEKVEANLLTHEIDKIYLEWGLLGVDGLAIDGQPATGELIIAKGPEDLTREIVEAIRSQCGLSEEERKN
jgi:hypothetical protein